MRLVQLRIERVLYKCSPRCSACARSGRSPRLTRVDAHDWAALDYGLSAVAREVKAVREAKEEAGKAEEEAEEEASKAEEEAVRVDAENKECEEAGKAEEVGGGLEEAAREVWRRRRRHVRLPCCMQRRRRWLQRSQSPLQWRQIQPRWWQWRQWRLPL